MLSQLKNLRLCEYGKYRSTAVKSTNFSQSLNSNPVSDLRILERGSDKLSECQLMFIDKKGLFQPQ